MPSWGAHTPVLLQNNLFCSMRRWMQHKYSWAIGSLSSISFFLPQFRNSGHELYSPYAGIVHVLSIIPVPSMILTADTLLARNWPCDPVCTLCNQEHETASHLILHCSFARQVSSRMVVWTSNIIQMPAHGVSILDWWEKELVHFPRKERRLKASMMIYGAWNIWKARNRRVFDHKSLTPAEVMQEIKTEVNCRKMACGRPEIPSSNV